MIAEWHRLEEEARREQNWQRWGPYLSERQWGTVREDYSPWGTAWSYFTHEQAAGRAYRWGEDGLLGICDREGRLAFALALWNDRDPVLKERLFGLTGEEGNHAEDVKECYFYLDSTPTHSYMKALYKYPQSEFPYRWLRQENACRGREQREFELLDTGVFDGDRYFDVFAEYAKAACDDIRIRITAANRSLDAAVLHLLPTLWFRNTWSWGRTGEGYWPKPRMRREGDTAIICEHVSLGRFRLECQPGGTLLFTENETNAERLFGSRNAGAYVKDAFHDYVIAGRAAAVNPAGEGTKAAAYYRLELGPGAESVIELRLSGEPCREPYVSSGDVFALRMREAEEFYAAIMPRNLSADARRIERQAYAGLLWSKQFFHYSVADWLEGDPAQPAPPATRMTGRNSEWRHLYNRDVISMPDKWEYPWYAAWDLAFHMLTFCRIDPSFAKNQLILLLREWYMHPNGQIPAYEFNFSDVNPPVHAWSCWRVYKMTGPRGGRDRVFLARAFHKLLINFTWWVNRKDVEGNNLFTGGFLGLDNIGVFDRSKLLSGRQLEQADGTAWMAFYCLTMLSMALELASEDPAYEDVASKFFEHFVAIADAMNTLGGNGLWDEADGFYYDQLHIDGTVLPLRVRSMVGLIPLFAVEVLDHKLMSRLPGFRKRTRWFLENRRDLSRHIAYMEHQGDECRLLSIPSRERLMRVLARMLDENEFLSPYGIRSLSRFHREHPYVLHSDGEERRVEYVPGESNSSLFGGNSNWRGPVWFPLNYLLIEALERYHRFYGDALMVECPTGSGRMANLRQVARELTGRLTRLFLPDANGRAAWQGADARWSANPHWQNLDLFYEFFHGENGQGYGASHQTGWTALIVRCLDDLCRHA